MVAYPEDDQQGKTDILVYKRNGNGDYPDKEGGKKYQFKTVARVNSSFSVDMRTTEKNGYKDGDNDEYVFVALPTKGDRTFCWWKFSNQDMLKNAWIWNSEENNNAKKTFNPGSDGNCHDEAFEEKVFGNLIAPTNNSKNYVADLEKYKAKCKKRQEAWVRRIDPRDDNVAIEMNP